MKSKAWNWNQIKDKSRWLEPCEEIYYYAHKWKEEGCHSVLDLGCGLGRHSIFLAKQGFCVTAADFSQEGLDYLRKWKEKENVNILCRKMDMRSMPFAADAFDCIFAYHSISHTDILGMKEIIREIKRVLKPGGKIFLSLCSKDTLSYMESDYPHIDENTIIKQDGEEEEVPHCYVDKEEILLLFQDFKIHKIIHAEECYVAGDKRNSKHYLVEAEIVKSPVQMDYSTVLNQKVDCVIDRPLGTCHPRCSEILYSINYGYVPGVIGGDGSEQDVYILGIDRPLKQFSGIVIGIYHRLNDCEDKWIVTSKGNNFTKEEILEKIHFQEQYFDGQLYL